MDSALLWKTFAARLDAAGDAAAVVHREHTWSARDLRRAADSLARGLVAAGIGEGALVALSLENSFALVAATLALWRISATVALVPPNTGPRERAAILSDARPETWLAAATDAPDLGRLLGLGCSPIDHGAPLDLDLVALSRREAGQPRNDALVKFTSGSTGVPKGIILEADNVLAEADQIRTTLSLGATDRILAPVSLSHSYGFDLGVLGSLMSGAALHLAPPFVPRRFLGDVIDNGITHVLGVPALYRALLRVGADRPVSAAGLRYLLSCTAPLQGQTVLDFHARFGLPICQHYGSSEVGAATTHDPARVLDLPESVGRPMDGVEVELVGQDGGPVAPGETGEVAVCSRAASRRYLMGAPEGRTPFRDGRFHMGDLGFMRDGFLTVVGRLDNLINVGGLKVAPEEVVKVLESHPAVAEAAVAGASTESGEEVVYAAVVLSSQSTEAELLGFCRARLAEHKVPRRIDVRRELPRGPTGKVRFPGKDLSP